MNSQEEKGKIMNKNRLQKPICSHCKSDEIVANACATWDMKKQQWIIETIYDNGHSCMMCDADALIEWVTVPEKGE